MKRLAIAALAAALLAACGGSETNACEAAVDRQNEIVREMNAIVHWQTDTLDQYGAPYSDALPDGVKAEWDRRQSLWNALDASVDEAYFGQNDC